MNTRDPSILKFQELLNCSSILPANRHSFRVFRSYSIIYCKGGILGVSFYDLIMSYSDNLSYIIIFI